MCDGDRHGLPAAPALAPHRFTVAEYYRMAETGILGADDRVELLDGQIVDMSPMGPPHAAAGERVRHVLSATIFERRSRRAARASS
ncbi:MAG: Uma2 family endonuclease [Chloroflexota bacterium]|nr:Uma2 family endonuclease [Chloroflexota bacterium]